MKKVLFLIEDLKFGGAEVSLVNLLNSLDFENHNFSTVLLMWGDHYEIIDSLKPNKHIKVRRVRTGFIKFISKLALKFIGNEKSENLKNRLIYSLVVLKIEIERPDIIIRYHQHAIRKLFTKIGRKTENISWYHLSSYNDYYLNEKYVSNCDKVVCVNDACKSIIEAKAPYLSEKLCAIRNIIPVSDILAKAECKEKLFNEKNFNILTCGRLSPEKGIDIAVKACKLIESIIPELKWYVVGDVDDCRAEYADVIKNLIKKNALEDKFILLGAKKNPYPYFKQCNLYVQPSREESMCFTIAEAQICGRAVVSTNTVGAKSLIENGLTGCIVDCDEQAISDAVYELFENRKKLHTLEKNVRNIDFGQINNDILKKFYDLIGA